MGKQMPQACDHISNTTASSIHRKVASSQKKGSNGDCFLCLSRIEVRAELFFLVHGGDHQKWTFLHQLLQACETNPFPSPHFSDLSLEFLVFFSYITVPLRFKLLQEAFPEHPKPLAWEDPPVPPTALLSQDSLCSAQYLWTKHSHMELWTPEVTDCLQKILLSPLVHSMVPTTA